MTVVRRDCFYYLRYAGRDWCKLPWYEGDIAAEPVEADCEGCEHYALNRPRVVEIDDADEEQEP